MVFDLDGTLVDSYGAIATSLNHARAAFGMGPMSERDVRRRVGYGLPSLMAEVLGPQRVEVGVRLFRDRYALVFADQTRALPQARETLEELHRRGYRLSVASNKPALFGEPILDRLGMLPFLDAVLGPDSADAAKPDPAMIHLCLRAMKVPPEAALYVGDMVLDVETASRAGMPLLFVPGGSSDARELQITGVRIIPSLAELLSILPLAVSPTP